MAMGHLGHTHPQQVASARGAHMGSGGGGDGGGGAAGGGGSGYVWRSSGGGAAPLSAAPAYPPQSPQPQPLQHAPRRAFEGEQVTMMQSPMHQPGGVMRR